MYLSLSIATRTGHNGWRISFKFSQVRNGRPWMIVGVDVSHDSKIKGAYGPTGYGTARYGTVRHGTARYSTGTADGGRVYIWIIFFFYKNGLIL